MASSRRILIVDDHPINIQFLGAVLRKHGYAVATAASGAQALAEVAAQRPDLLISDIHMPGMDGFELNRQLKGGAETRDLPVIFLTASDNPDDERRGLEEGAVDFLTKPVNPPVMLARVQTHLRLQDALWQMKLQNALLQENAKLREEVENISRHDLKSPLTAVIALPELLLENGRNLTDGQTRILRNIRGAGLLMLEMINRSLDLLKMERGTYHPDLNQVDLLDILMQVVDTLQSGMAGKGLIVETLLDGRPARSGDRLPFQSDGLLLYSMFSNLTKNAAEAAPAGSTIRIALSGADRLSIEIGNQGEVPEAIRPHFFEKYSTAGKAKGTGLGAYSAQLIARTLGGTLELDSSIPGRTRLLAAFPATPVPAPLS
jgi:CheY-like chemotaxis protein